MKKFICLSLAVTVIAEQHKPPQYNTLDLFNKSELTVRIGLSNQKTYDSTKNAKQYVTEWLLSPGVEKTNLQIGYQKTYGYKYAIVSYHLAPGIDLHEAYGIPKKFEYSSFAITFTSRRVQGDQAASYAASLQKRYPNTWGRSASPEAIYLEKQLKQGWLYQPLIAITEKK